MSMEQNEIEDLINSNEVFRPILVHSGRIRLNSQDDYRTIYERTIADLGEY